jgi:hypothetical protein
MDFPLKYIGQTCGTFYTRYKEHIQAVGNNKGNSVYSNRIINTGHPYWSITANENHENREKGKTSKYIRKYYIYIYIYIYIYKVNRNILHINNIDV